MINTYQCLSWMQTPVRKRTRSQSMQTRLTGLSSYIDFKYIYEVYLLS